MLNLQPLSENKWECFLSETVKFIRGELAERKKDGLLLGISGGIDSALVAAIAVKTVGVDKVKGLILPDRDSNESTVKDSLLVANHLGIHNVILQDISPCLEAFGTYQLFSELYELSYRERVDRILAMKKELVQKEDINDCFMRYYRLHENKQLNAVRAFWNSKIRMRMITFFYHAELSNYLVLGTTNLTEYKVGWFTKYGDGASDFNAILPLYKTRVYELSRYLKIPERIIEKTPSGDILPGVDDENSIGLTYYQIDQILIGLEKGLSHDAISNFIGISQEDVATVNSLIKSSEYNRAGEVSMNINIEGEPIQ